MSAKPRRRFDRDFKLQLCRDLASGQQRVAAGLVPVTGGGICFTSCPNCAYGAEEAGCFSEAWKSAAAGPSGLQGVWRGLPG